MRNYSDLKLDFGNLPDPDAVWKDWGDFALIGMVINVELALKNPYYSNLYQQKLEDWLNQAWGLTPAWFDLFCNGVANSTIDPIGRTQKYYDSLEEIEESVYGENSL